MNMLDILPIGTFETVEAEAYSRITMSAMSELTYAIDLAAEKSDDDEQHRAWKNLNSFLSTRIGNWSNDDNKWMEWQAASYSENGIKYSGIFTKRIAKKYFKLYGTEISPKGLELVGSVLGKYMQKQNLHFSIKKAFNWKAGDFAERDGSSCWWSSHVSSRLGMISEKYGYAFLVYENEDQYKKYEGKKGIGRAWMVIQPDMVAIFNAYGKAFGAAQIASALAERYNLEARKKSLLSPGAYINQGNLNNMERLGGEAGVGWILIHKDAAEGRYSDNLIVLPDFAKNIRLCSICDRKCETKNMKAHETIVMCPNCYAKEFPVCMYCGESFTKEDNLTPIMRTREGREPEHGLICHDCIKSRHLDQPSTREQFTCSVHGLTTSVTMTVFHTSRRVCKACMSENSHTGFCNGCRRVFDNLISIESPGVPRVKLCRTCAKQIRVEIKRKLDSKQQENEW